MVDRANLSHIVNTMAPYEPAVQRPGPCFSRKMSYLTSIENPIVEIKLPELNLCQKWNFLYWQDDIFLLNQPTNVITSPSAMILTMANGNDLHFSDPSRSSDTHMRQ